MSTPEKYWCHPCRGYHDAGYHDRNLVSTPSRMEAFALDDDGRVLARADVDGTGRLVFDDVDGAAVKLVRWTDADGVTHDHRPAAPATDLEPRPKPDGPHGDCPECGRRLPLDVDPDDARFVPLHGGWPPCGGSGMPA